MHPPRENQNTVSDQKTSYEFKTGWIDLTKGPKVDDMGKLEKRNNLNRNVFELNEDKTLTQFYVPKSMKKSKNEDNLENSQQDFHEDNHSHSEHGIQVTLRETKTTTSKLSMKSLSKNFKTIDSRLYRANFHPIKNISSN